MFLVFISVKRINSSCFGI